MKYYFPYIVAILFASLSIVYTVDYENQIETLQKELEIIDSLNCTIDSLQLEIDTLVFENEIWDYNI